MPLSVKDVSGLQVYLTGVMKRADHHARNVNEIALALAGAIVWRKDDDREIKVRARDGEAKNVLWVRIGGQQYAFSYNHEDGTIEMREDNVRGAVLHSFSNSTPLSDLRRIFEAL